MTKSTVTWKATYTTNSMQSRPLALLAARPVAVVRELPGWREDHVVEQGADRYPQSVRNVPDTVEIDAVPGCLDLDVEGPIQAGLQGQSLLGEAGVPPGCPQQLAEAKAPTSPKIVIVGHSRKVGV